VAVGASEQGWCLLEHVEERRDLPERVEPDPAKMRIIGRRRDRYGVASSSAMPRQRKGVERGGRVVDRAPRGFLSGLMSSRGRATFMVRRTARLNVGNEKSRRGPEAAEVDRAGR